MILLLDIGNTRIKWAVVKDQIWLQEGYLSLQEIEKLPLMWQQLDQPEKIFASNVASELIGQQLEKFAQSCFSRPIYWLTVNQTCCGVTHFCEPEGKEGKTTLGTDRWAAIIAAHHLYPGHKIIAGLGTAMVVEALTGRGEFLGGLILPGIHALQSVLKTSTARVVFDTGQYQAFPKNTGDAVYTGIITGLSSTVNTMVNRLAEHCGVSKSEIKGIISGGDANAVLPYLDLAFEYIDNLVLQGLLFIAQNDKAVWRRLDKSYGLSEKITL